MIKMITLFKTMIEEAECYGKISYLSFDEKKASDFFGFGTIVVETENGDTITIRMNKEDKK